MTIEIRELIIQARVDDASSSPATPARHTLSPVTAEYEHEAMVAQITRRVLQHLRDAQEGWL